MPFYPGLDSTRHWYKNIHFVTFELRWISLIYRLIKAWFSFALHCKQRAYIVAVHYDDVIMTTIASQITSLTSVYSTVYSDADQRKHQSSASLAFVRGIHRDRWIPRTKGQLRGKCLHLMTSSWISDARLQNPAMTSNIIYGHTKPLNLVRV